VTSYRLDNDMLHEGDGPLFTDIAYEISGRESIDEGYVCPLINCRRSMA
jgi:DNA repair protein RadD